MAEGIYAETLVKRKMAWWAVLAYVAMGLGIFVSLLLIITGTYMMIGGIMAAVVGIVIFITWRFLKVEYEYIFVTDELQIDRIYSGESRKKGPRVTLGEMEWVRKTNREEVKRWKANGGIVEDFTSGEKGKEIYAVSSGKNGQVRYILFEPNEKLISLMERVSPSKVKMS